MLHLFQDIFKSPAQDFSVIFPWLFHNPLKNVNKWVPTISYIPISLTCNEIGHAQFKDTISEANVLDSGILGFGNSHKEHFHLFSPLSALTSEFFTFPPLQLKEKLLKSCVLMLRFLCWPSAILHWNPTKLTTSPYQVERYTEINASHMNDAFFFPPHLWFCLGFATCIHHHLLLGSNSYLLYLIFHISNFLL